MTQHASRIAAQSQYEVMEQVGQGQFAQVFRGVHRETREEVALKQVSFKRSPPRQFLRELHLLARLHHPNIVKFHGLHYSQQGRYLVTDFCRAGTLRDRMEAAEPLKLVQSVKLVVDILSGLACAHHHGVVHCDLKPENILLTEQDGTLVAKIADFGVARLMEQIERELDGADIMGSPAYMAPECYYQKYTYAADVYAVGILLYELVVGDRPFSGPPGKLMSAHLNQPFVLPETIPFALQASITKALKRLPQQRFSNASEMLKSVHLALEILLATEPDKLIGRPTA